jgi:hypothetical protein
MDLDDSVDDDSQTDYALKQRHLMREKDLGDSSSQDEEDGEGNMFGVAKKRGKKGAMVDS